MTTSVQSPAGAAGTQSVPTAVSGAFPRWFRDKHGWIAAALYLLAILAYDHHAVTHMSTSCGCSLSPDPTQWMWSWSWIPWAIAHGHNPFFTSEIWYPGPFNLAAVTLAPVMAIPGVPLQALFGPVAAFNILLFVAPVVSGWSAYRLCRYLSGAPWASILAGYTYGFSSYELAHELAHMNLIWTFAPALLALVLARHMNGEISRRRAATQLSLICLVEFGISTEVFFTMILLVIVAAVVGWLLATPPWRARIVSAVIVLAIAGAVTGVVWSYYIYESFQAPATSAGFPLIFPSDLLSYLIPNDMFRIGRNFFAGIAGKFFTNDVSEQNSYLGLPLILIFFGYAVSQWRRLLTKVVVAVTFVAFVLSLGVKLTIAGQQTIAMPYSLVENLPLFKLLTPSRFGLYVSLGAAVAAALWLAAASGRASRLRRWLLALAAVLFLFPNLSFANADFNLRVSPYPQPAFFTTNLYKHYLHRGEVVMPLPFSFAADGLSMLWQADTDMYFKLASGYFGTNPPASYESNPLVQGLLNGTIPTGAAGDLNELARTHDISAIVVLDGVSSGYIDVIKQAGWRLTGAVGGVQVYRRASALR